MSRYLSSGQDLFIHARLIERFGRIHGLRDSGALEAAISRPQATFGGKDLYPDIMSKAAALAHSLLINHPFVDGNKRTAFACMELFLQENNYVISADDDACEEMILRVIRKEMDDRGIATWLRKNSRPL